MQRLFLIGVFSGLDGHMVFIKQSSYGVLQGLWQPSWEQKRTEQQRNENVNVSSWRSRGKPETHLEPSFDMVTTSYMEPGAWNLGTQKCLRSRKWTEVGSNKLNLRNLSFYL